jgi:hypothetical protein
MNIDDLLEDYVATERHFIAGKTKQRLIFYDDHDFTELERQGPGKLRSLPG